MIFIHLHLQMVASSIYAFDLTKRVPVYEFKGIHTLGVNSLKTIFFRVGGG